MVNNKLVDKSLANQEWYQALVEECRAIIVEAVFTSRWALVEGYWNLGDRILAEHENFEREKIYGKKIVACMRESLGKSESTIWRAIQFRKKYPDLSKAPEGKNLSWHKVCAKYLSKHPVQEEDIMRVVVVFLLVIKDGEKYIIAKRIPPKPINHYSFQEIIGIRLTTGVDVPWEGEVLMAVIELSEFVSDEKLPKAKAEIENAINKKLGSLVNLWKAKTLQNHKTMV